MRKPVTLAAAVTIALALPAGAEAERIDSTVYVQGGGPAPPIASAHGSILSERRRCLSGRTIKIAAIVGGERVPLRTDVSSRNGYWGGEGTIPAQADEFRIRMKPKRLSKRKKCKGDRSSSLDTAPMFTAARETFPSALQYHLSAYAGDEVGGAGHIESTKRCLSARRVEVYGAEGDTRTFAARDISSRNGWWGAFAPASAPGVEYRLRGKKLGRRGNRCGGDVVVNGYPNG